MLLQLYLLSRKLHRLDQAIEGLESPAKRDELRDRIFPFVFSHMIVGHQHGIAVRALIHLMMWLTLAILPVLLLLWAQLAFLPYHGWWITWGPHRVSIVADLFLLWLFLPTLAHPEGRWRPGDTFDRWLYPRRFFWAVLSGMLSLVVLWLSFLVFLIPGNWLDRTLGTTPVIVWAFGETGLGGVLGHRNLVLPETTLLAEGPSQEILAAILRDPDAGEQLLLAHTKGLDLRGRDLRFADLWQANLTKADLEEAQLQGADLWNSQLKQADFWSAELQGADLEDAHLQRANLRDAQLQGSILQEAQLQGADLQFAGLQGASLPRAQLEGANLAGVVLQGAMLSRANLRGADLSGAWLQGADLSDAQLQGADLSRTHLQGADFSDAELQGADLSKARIHGANFKGANMTLSVLSHISWDPLSEKAWDLIGRTITESVPVRPTDTAGESYRDEVLARIEKARNRRSTILPEDEESFVVLADPAPIEDPGVQPWPLPLWWRSTISLAEFHKELSFFLSELACESEAVAASLSRRAQDSFEADANLSRRLAAGLVNRREICPGIGALPEATLARLHSIAVSAQRETPN
jgi:uncharacterized protein YjbI with pentapeptide repeats